MKKWIALLLAAVACLSLAACGQSGEAEKYKKYETLIDYMEAKDYESALAEMIRISGYADEPEDGDPEDGEPEDTEPSETEPEAHTVELTLDNWQDYLEINQYLSVTYSTNSFGEVTDTYLSLYTILEPKEEYSKVEMDWSEGNAIAVEYDSDTCVSDIIYNLDDFSFELIDCVSHPDAKVDESSFWRGRTSQIPALITIGRDKIVDGKVERDSIEYDNYHGKRGMPLGGYGDCSAYIVQNEDGTGFIQECPTNIKITRIQGTLKYYDPA